MEDSSRDQILQSEQHEAVENFKILKTENGEQVKIAKIAVFATWNRGIVRWEWWVRPADRQVRSLVAQIHQEKCFLKYNKIKLQQQYLRMFTFFDEDFFGDLLKMEMHCIGSGLFHVGARIWCRELFLCAVFLRIFKFLAENSSFSFKNHGWFIVL